MKRESSSEENFMPFDSPPWFDLSKELGREHKPSTDTFEVTENGTLISSRWLNKDGTYKTGLDLETETLKVELADISRRLLSIAKRFGDVPSV
jgi:hypothetical protein